jgi:hypothetical protein
MKKTLAGRRPHGASSVAQAPGDAHTRLIRAARKGVRDALKAHKQAGHAIVVVEGGRVRRVAADKIAV